MYPAVCAECAKECEVPFEPREGRPVYCSDCYNKIKPSSQP
jgi:CxxC-x17-CxxC domain-containing protein